MPSNKDLIKEVLTRSITETIPSREVLEQALVGGKKLTIYLGIDPTGPALHLGHSVNLFQLRRFQKLGHRVILLMGDFTARIGDPSGKKNGRSPLSKKEVDNNLKKYKEQASKILDFTKNVRNPATIERNSKWLSKLKFEDVLGLASNFTVQQMLARDMFQKRIGEGSPIGLSEFLYPLMQGYDSVALKTDIEIGGNDQLFNMLVGRDLVKVYLGKEKFVLTSRLLVDPTSGIKMSKTEGALVALSDEPNDMYAKVMSFPDELTRDCFELCTELAMGEIGKVMKNSPRDAKARLAREIVTIYHSAQVARDAESEFNKTFREHKTPSDIKTIRIGKKKVTIMDLLVESGLISSKSEARRVVEQGGVKINGEVKNDWKEEIELKGETLAQVGKRRFVRVIP